MKFVIIGELGAPCGNAPLKHDNCAIIVATSVDSSKSLFFSKSP